VDTLFEAAEIMGHDPNFIRNLLHNIIIAACLGGMQRQQEVKNLLDRTGLSRLVYTKDTQTIKFQKLVRFVLQN
jgi:hypothetical protein